MFVGFLWFIADCYEKKMAMAVPLSSFFAHSLVRLLEPLLSFIIMCIAHHIFRTCICSKDAFLSDMSIVKIWNRCFRVGTLALLRCSVQRQVARGVICVGIDCWKIKGQYGINFSFLSVKENIQESQKRKITQED